MKMKGGEKKKMIYNVGGKKFDTEKSRLVATSRIPGRNAGYDEGTGRWTNLYRTEKGNWIFVHVTCWQGERCYAELAKDQEAKEFIMEYGDKDVIQEFCGDIEEL